MQLKQTSKSVPRLALVAAANGDTRVAKLLEALFADSTSTMETTEELISAVAAALLDGAGARSAALQAVAELSDRLDALQTIIGQPVESADEVHQTPCPLANARLADDEALQFYQPSVLGATTGGGATYTLRSCQYQQIGNRVFFSVETSWAAHTGTGPILIYLPITARAGALNSPVSVYASGFTFPAGQLMGFVAPNTKYVQLFSVNSGALSTPVPVSASGTVYLSGFYEV
jgi:hypothetical protein